MEPSPLARAAELAALRSLARSPDPASDLGRATAPSTVTIRAFAPEKADFDEVQRALIVARGARVTQVETLRWVLSFAREHHEAFLAHVRRGVSVGSCVAR